jgi:hypothetical protein
MRIDIARRVDNLDTMKRGSYKSRAFGLLAAAVVCGIAARAGATSVHGVQMPLNAQEVGENRYRSAQTYEETLKYFNTVYRGLPRKAIVNQPGIRAVHFEAVDPRAGYEGINIYEKDREARIYVIHRESTKKTEKSSKKVK